MRNVRLGFLYFSVDLIFSATAWTLFFVFRKYYIEDAEIEFDTNYYLGLFAVPLYWVTLFGITGTYKNAIRRYRLKELRQVISVTIIGVIVLFFVLLLDDEVSTYRHYYQSFLSYLGLQFFLVFIPRFLITSNTVRKVHRKKITFPTLIVGGNENAVTIYNELESLSPSSGNEFKGFVAINGSNHIQQQTELPYLGHFKDIDEILEKYDIEEVIIAIESSEHSYLSKIINALEERNIIIKIIPDIYDILTGSVKMTSIWGAPLIEVQSEIMPQWQKSVKRILDIAVSILAMIILSPVFIGISIAVILTSKGPVFFKQERIGLYGKPFYIYKFRSMFINAESDGPQLSSSNDNRITKVGRFLRKTRLDELPQFYNVLKGDMSLVGPRPERQYFINQIVVEAPHYKHLQKVRPGITSWGQVKYGYAENVEQMIQRLKYDVLYIENMSLALDFKIMFYTVWIILKGKGK